MSHQPTTDFDKFTTYKITTGQTVKRTSTTESHDDESKKLKLEKSGSVLNSNAVNAALTNTPQGTHIITTNNVMTGTQDLNAKKLKSRKLLNETNASAGYSLIVEDATNSTMIMSEESCESSGKTYATNAGGEELMFIRKQVSSKMEAGSSSLSNDGSSMEERIIHIEGDPSGNTASSYLTAMSNKPPPKRLQIGMAEAKKSLGDSIDLKLITTTDGQGGNKISVVGGDKKPEQILISASNTTINPQNTFTYSRVCSVSNVTGPGGEAVNLKSLQGACKNQSLMVSSKKLMPEVTQTTAKVSIGNTTISVPLLKPLNSTQIIQTSGSSGSNQGGSGDGTKSVIHTIQTGSNQSPQTQLSKILNIKRGQKGNQPTFVSLSQLQIKPVSSAKIVQAKVVSKKIPLHIQAVQANKTTLLQQTSGVVTITSTKPDTHPMHQSQQQTVQGHIIPSPQKKQQQLSFVKELPPGAIIKTSSTSSSSAANTEDSTSGSTNTSLSLASTEQTSSVSTDKPPQLIKTNSGGDSSSTSSIIATEYLPASVKVVHSSATQQQHQQQQQQHINASNIRSTLTTQMENIEQSSTQLPQQQQQQPQGQHPQQQQQRINICPTISIVRQNSPQLVTTSGNVSTVSLSMADAVSGQQKLILTKSQFANVSSANITTSMGNTITSNFPRNISLMLAKSSASQQVFTTSGAKNTLCVTTSTGNTKVAGGKRLNLNIQPNVVSSTTTSAAAATSSTQNEIDNSSTTATSTDNTPGGTVGQDTGNTNVQQVQQQQQPTTHITQNRKIIQVLPGGLYSSSGGSFVQITKTKPPQEEEDKKKMEIGEQQQHQPQQQQIQQQPQQQTQQIHLQIQQQSAQQQQQTQQQHPQQQPQQIHMQIQQQNHSQQIHLQQQLQNAQQRQQQLQQHRQQLLHKQHLQQLQKQQQQQQHQQHILNQQQLSQNQDSSNSSTNPTTENPTEPPKYTLNPTLTHASYNNPNTSNSSITSSSDQQHHLHHHLNPPPKAEESNNVLLKQLLQNSNSTPNSNQSNSSNISNSRSGSSSNPTAVLPARKVINVRAPSLGLVSSLEAQLARPVIPPVPASESSSASAVSQTPPTTSQALKNLNDQLKASATPINQGPSPAPTPPHSLSTTPTNTNNNAPSLIISTSKSSLIQHSSDNKPKLTSSPLISKETSFVSKPPTINSSSEQSEQNIEIFSLQQSLGVGTETSLKTEHQQHQQQQQQQQQQQPTETLASSQPTSVQMGGGGSQQSFKQFLHNSNQGGTLTTKISKYVQDVKKAAEQQQQQHHLQQQQQLQQQHLQQQQQNQQQQQQSQQSQQHQQLSAIRTFSSASTISNLSAINKEKHSGNLSLNTHAHQQTVSSTSNTTSLNVNVSQSHQQQFVGTIQQNKSFNVIGEGSLAESNNKAKVLVDNQSTTTAIQQLQQQTTHQQQNQILMQHMQQHQQQQSQQQQQTQQQQTLQQQQSQPQHHQQQQQQQIDPTKQVIKMEVDDTQNFQQIQQVQLQQQHQQHQQQQQQTQVHQQQQSFRSMATTPTCSVPSTPTNEGPPHLNIINKQQPQLLQHHMQQTQQQQQQQHIQQQMSHPIQTALSAASATAATATTAPNSATKDADRKKRKRDQQKQRRQLIGNTKDTATANSSPSLASTSNAANAKKRSRKSLKSEEDYDGFIDNLLLHMRQMQPLQVLEPQLNVNYGVCNIYGWRNWSRSSNSTSPVKESRQSERAHLFEQELEGEYGSGYLPNKVPFYDSKNFMDLKTNDDSNSTSIQNNFYDQEFTSFTYKTEPEKLTNWVKVYRERAVDAPEIVSNKLLVPVDPVKTMRLNMLQQETFPGLILMSSTQQKLGRMSPVIPFVNSMALISKRKKTPLKPLDNDAGANGLYIKDHLQDDMDNKMGHKNNQNVILSLPTSSAERLLDVLKNLANLLQLPSPIPYKVVETNADPNIEQKLQRPALTASEREMALKHLSIQDILNGKSKMCRHCGKAIKGRCIRNTDDSTKTSFHAKLVHPTQQRYFCNKVCYIQFRWGGEKKTSSAELQSVLDAKEAEDVAAAAGALANESDLDRLTDDKTGLKSLLDTVHKTDNKINTIPVATIVTTNDKPVEPVAKTKKVPFRYFNSKCFQPTTPVKRMSEKEIRDLLFKMDITMSVTTAQCNVGEPGSHHPIEDRRQCVLCTHLGDGVADGPSRLLNFDVDKWVHLNCALWSSEVYETISGGLVNFQQALHNGLNQSCNTCQQLGATVKCYKTRCGAVFHLPCAIRDQCVFYQNKTIHCQAHALRNDKDKELITLSVHRRVFVERDENRQVAAIMHHSEMINLMRVGSLIFLNVGQLLPHQLEAFHTTNYIYPIGFKIIRFYWSMFRPNKRCRYICTIAEVSGRPEFRIVVQEPDKTDIEIRDTTPKAVWQRVLQPLAEMRKTHNLVKLYPEFLSGEDLFGLTEPTIVRIIESLPGVETLTNYRFKYGRNPLLDLPLALNPSGAARTEPKLRHLKHLKHHPQRTCSNVNSGHHQGNMTSVAAAGEVSCPYSKQFVHSKSSQYKKMKQEWRNNVYLARSKIQGLGLYAARDMERHTMIIEYIGEVIRSEVSEIREKQYEARNRGIYMFRLDEDRVVDATLSGGLARYINHSCNPNCVTEIVEVDRESRIIIFAKRRINRGEELSYDYKFDLEDEGSKIPCMCGAPNCRKWMN